MHRSKRFLLIILSCMIVFAMPTKVFALGNGGFTTNPDKPAYGTIDWMAYHAFKLIKDVKPDYVVWLDQRINYFYLGTEAPDNPNLKVGSKFSGWNDSISQFNRYSLNDSTVVADEDYQNCSLLVLQHYSSLVHALQVRDYDLAAWEAGVVAHYLAVLAGWGHVLTVYNGTTYVMDNTGYSNYSQQLDDVLEYPSQEFPDVFPTLYLNQTKVSPYLIATELGAYTFRDDEGVSAEEMKALFNGNKYTCYAEWDATLKNATTRRLAKGIMIIAQVLHSALIDGNYHPEFQVTFTNVVLIFGISVISVIVVGIALALWFGTRKQRKKETGQENPETLPAEETLPSSEASVEEGNTGMKEDM